MANIEDKFKGCLIGLAVGDALGAPIEEIPTKPTPYNGPKPVTEMVGGGFLKLKPGQITDDTEMALCIAKSLVERKQFDPEDIANRFVEWFYDSNIGSGSTTRTALKRIKQGILWYEAGKSEKGLQSLGNGSVMRCAPVALFDYKHPEQLIQHSRDQGLITHPHKDCIDSCIFVNSIIAHILVNKYGRNYDSYNDGGLKYDAYVESLDAIKANCSLWEQYKSIPVLSEEALKTKLAGNVRDTTETAIYSILATWSFEDAIIKAVNLGGDTDTRGAIAGAIAGAYYGESGIPDRWKLQLVDRHQKPIYHELCELALSLYQLSQR